MHRDDGCVDHWRGAGQSRSPGGALSVGHAGLRDPGIHGSGADDADRLRRCHTAYVSARNPWSRQRNVCIAWEFGEDCGAAVGGMTLGMQGSSTRCHRRDASGHLP